MEIKIFAAWSVCLTFTQLLLLLILLHAGRTSIRVISNCQQSILTASRTDPQFKLRFHIGKSQRKDFPDINAAK